jgi:hypothetical protein
MTLGESVYHFSKIQGVTFGRSQATKVKRIVLGEEAQVFLMRLYQEKIQARLIVCKPNQVLNSNLYSVGYLGQKIIELSGNKLQNP